jgi:hypothetical protein
MTQPTLQDISHISSYAWGLIRDGLIIGKFHTREEAEASRSLDTPSEA